MFGVEHKQTRIIFLILTYTFYTDDDNLASRHLVAFLEEREKKTNKHKSCEGCISFVYNPL